ncbi:MAG: Xaa-Pro peptidase family protein [Actinomycetota bacterium]|nr:Xaa-Pro peptidase family protein [Actinomycetota bacterium]
MDYARRLASATELLARHDVDALLVTDLTNVRYLTGFSGTNGQVLVNRSGATFFTDGRYEARAASLVRDADIVIYERRLNDSLKPVIEKAGVRRLGVEAETMTIGTWQRLKNVLTKCDVVATSDAVEGLRRTKDDVELERIREAVRVGDATFAAALDAIVPGKSTEREVALFIETELRRRGAEEPSFPPIVASGPLSAHVHHTASDRVIEKSDLVVLDLGCKLDGYCSDLTRTIVVGPASDEQRELHAVVLQAQRAALASMRPGIGGKDVDAAARAIIDEANTAGDFKHGLGHGVGLAVHEAPRLHRLSDDVLAPRDVVTVEPGLYETGRDGLRIEDCVAVTTDGVEVLSTAPKDELIEL